MHPEVATPARTGPVVADAMIRFPKLCGTGTTVEQARDHLLDGHVHALLVVDGGLLVAVVERDDLAGAAATDLAWPLGRLAGRVVGADDDLAAVTRAMAEQGRRRVAVVVDGRLTGLLCRKRSERGFCSDAGIAARVRDRSSKCDQPAVAGSRPPAQHDVTV